MAARRDRIARRVSVVLALVVASGAGAALGAGPAAAAVGGACADCHEAEVAAFAGSPHARAFRHGDDPSADCASCHGDPAAHIEAGDGSNIVVPGDLKPAEIEQSCMTCHSGNVAQTHWQGSMHQRRGVTCLDCHSIHAEASADSMVNAAMKTDACYKCHQDVRSEMNKVSHP